MPYSDSNASAEALSLLGQFFGKDAQVLREQWDLLRDILARENETVRVRDDGWEQDWLLVKYGIERPAIATGAWYDPPPDFHSFPTFDVDIHTAYLKDRAGITIRQTRNNLDLPGIFSRTADTFAGPMVLDQFYELQSQIRAHGDPAMAQFNQTLAWVQLGVGKVFSGIVLTPDVEVPTAVSMLAQRWQLILAEQDPYEGIMNVPERIQWKLDVFYGAEMGKDHITFTPARQGQPKRWQQHWQWLSSNIEPQRALEATRLAARLMISPPILLFLKAMVRGGPDVASDGERLVALAILRRLTLQLQVMSWFEHALSHNFAHARVEDLASFAFSALRPHWPRRLLAVSHRSKDVKPELMKLRAWGNFRYSLDAMFPPHWETNVAMVWGLFSAVPGLIRVRSPNYDDSVWCRREREIFDYLCDEDDFLRGRHVIEIDEADLPLLDAQIPEPDPKAAEYATPGSFPPPFTSVFIVFPYEAWECRLLACATVMRMLFSVVRKAADAAVMCQLISQGQLPQGLNLTNHPDGWAPITGLLRTFQQEWSDDPNLFPMAIDDQAYTPEDIERDIACHANIIDLSDGAIDQPAVFAALEWDRTIAPAMIGNGRYGRFFAADYRRLTPDLWRSDEHMVIRGVNRVHTSVPLWILQRAGQNVDEWPGIGMTPIFTQYVEKQWRWMGELLDEPRWPETWRKESKLLFAPKLAAACAATTTRNNSYYQGKIS